MHLVGRDSIIVGIDVHKYSHQAVAMSCFGEELSKLEFSNDEAQKCINWLSALGKQKDIIVGLEDVNGLGIHLTQYLQTAGFNLRYIPAVYTERARKHSSSQDKNDYLDAKRVGKVILQQAEETLPASDIIPQEIVRNLDLLLQEREALVKEQTALKNQLHGLLHQYYGNGYKQSFKNIFSEIAIEWYLSDLKKCEGTIPIKQSTQAYVTGSSIRRYLRLGLIVKQIKEITKLIETTGMLIKPVTILSKSMPGCGLVTACKVIVEIGNIQRFTNESKLAKYSGIAPRQSQSGKSNRYYTNPFGNRKLNKAIHIIALSQIGNRGSKEGKAYFKKKITEGKSKLWALRCLKRFIIRRIYILLAQSVTSTKN